MNQSPNLPVRQALADEIHCILKEKSINDGMSALIANMALVIGDLCVNHKRDITSLLDTLSDDIRKRAFLAKQRIEEQMLLGGLQ